MANPTPVTNGAVQRERLQPPPSRRRDKPQLSCTLCRRRKLRCDRNQPCSTCSSRGLSFSCAYVSSAPSSANRVGQARNHPDTAPSMQDRIAQLEGLVVGLMNAAPTPLKMFGADEVALSDSFGRISLESSETRYVSGDHWLAILDGIAELKHHFEHPSFAAPSPPNNPGPPLLYGCNNRATKESILHSLPPRPVVDRLVSKYFNDLDMAPTLIHAPTFLREYENFWSHPAEVPILWIGLLFGVMAISAYINHQQFESADYQRMLETYRGNTAQCLVLGRYTNSGPYSMEALLLYFATEYLVAPDTTMDNWILVGIIVRLAMRMGFHRDPCHIPHISPFDAEMRRRLWANIVHIDLAASTQVGLPRMINASVCDTAEPQNLLDEDFNKDTVELPPSRPDSEMTPVVYTIARNRILSAFGAITDLSNLTSLPSYEDVMQLDRMLHAARSAIPAGLKMRPFSLSITEHPDVITRRIYLDMIFNTARCILHRKYLNAARSNTHYAYSRTSCVDAASQILKHQDFLHQETQPGGRLFGSKWKSSTSAFKCNMLLAITILCLDINRDLELASTSDLKDTPAERERRENVIRALHRSSTIWNEAAHTSQEACKAAEILRVVLGKVRRTSVAGNSDYMLFDELPHLDVTASARPPLKTDPHEPITYDFQSFEGPALPDTRAPGHLGEAVSETSMGGLDDVALWGADFDWDSWDAHFRGQIPADLAIGDDSFIALEQHLKEPGMQGN